MRTILLASAFLCFALDANAQKNWEHLVSQSQSQWLLNALVTTDPDVQTANTCPPDLKQAIPEPSAFDEALHPYEIDPEVEAECISQLFANDCMLLQNLRMLSDLYFPLFERHLQAHKLEEDFKYLPLVLSALNSGYSDQHNKAGLWGLDFPRAKKAGLRMDAFVDERLAPDPSTQVAMSLLTTYKERYHGDLLKMMVAMMRGVNFADQFSPDQKLDAELTFELTALHVCLRLFKNTESSNQLMSWLTYLNSYEAVGFKKTFPFEALSLIPSANLKDLRGINTCYIGDSIPGLFRGVPFLLHKNSVEEFKALEDSIYNYKPVQSFPEKVVTPSIPDGESFIYTVKSGDVLGRIAEKHGVRVSELKRWNGLRGDNIDIGQKLTIYGDATAKPANKPEPVAPAPKSSGQGPYEEYVVKSGDSLWIIAKQYPGVSAENIMEWNGGSNNIRPGQKLKIYTTK